MRVSDTKESDREESCCVPMGSRRREEKRGGGKGESPFSFLLIFACEHQS